jgi:cobalt/nickel transport protein
MKRFYLIGFFVSISLAAVLSPFACSWRDGLERVAADYGFESAGEEPAVEAPVPDYEFPYVENEYLSTALAGGVGTSLVFAGLFGFGFIITRLRKR